nr:uncharacterized protein LOC113693508 [Coffea arabica]
MAPYEALYGRKCRSPIYWDEVGEKKILDPTIIPWMEDAQEKIKLIRQRLQTAQSRQKSYADNRRKDLEFEVGDQVFLKITPLRSVTAGRGKKLQPRFVGPFRSFNELERGIEIDEALTYEEKPVQVLDRKVKELRNKQIPLVKVLWKNHGVEEATWEMEDDMKTKYPELFSASGSSALLPLPPGVLTIVVVLGRYQVQPPPPLQPLLPASLRQIYYQNGPATTVGLHV